MYQREYRIIYLNNAEIYTMHEYNIITILLKEAT